MKRQKVWDLYAKIYDKLFTQKTSLTPTRRVVLEFLRDVITDPLQEYKVLDCGCGTGRLLFDLNEKYKNYNLKLEGIDLSRKMLEQAERRNQAGNIGFNWGDIKDFRGARQYDVIICTHALSYFPGVEEVVKNFYSLLKEGGTFCLAQTAPDNRYDKAILRLLKLVTSESVFHSTEEIKSLLSGNGFDRMELQYIKETKLMPTIFALKCRKSQAEQHC